MDNILIRPLTKEKLEEYLGYEINKFKEELVNVDGELKGISIYVEPISAVKYINIDFIVTSIENELKDTI